MQCNNSTGAAVLVQYTTHFRPSCAVARCNVRTHILALKSSTTAQSLYQQHVSHAIGATAA